METNLVSNQTYKAAIVSVLAGYILNFVMPWFDLPEIFYTLLLLIAFGLLGFGYKTILIRKDLPSCFMVFGGFAVLLFLGGMLAQLFSLIIYLLKAIV